MKKCFKSCADAAGGAKVVTISRNQSDQTRLQYTVFVSGIILLGLALLVPDQASARWYKWVDESGNISYQDRPPPADYDESTQVLNGQGVTVERVPSKKERLAQEKKMAAIRAERQHDQMLIKSFPREVDLTRTRDKRLGHIDGTVSRMHDQLVILNSRLSSIDAKIRGRVSNGQSKSAGLESDRIAVMRSINSTNALIKSKLRERRQVAKKFSTDLARYRELTTHSANAAYSEN